MPKVKALLDSARKRAIALVKTAWRTEPTRVVGAVVTVVLAGGSGLGIALDKATVAQIVTFVMSALVPPTAAEGLRRKVRPEQK